MTPEEEMKEVEKFRETGEAYVAPDDGDVMDYTTKPAPEKEKEGGRS
jgi:hypothetical protein